MHCFRIEKQKGLTEVVIDSDCDFEKFYSVAKLLEKDFKMEFIQKLNDFDTLYRDFLYNGYLLIFIWVLASTLKTWLGRRT